VWLHENPTAGLSVADVLEGAGQLFELHFAIDEWT
jgi:hypothetical protein